MSPLLGRGEYRGWPTRWPVGSLGALALAVVAGIGIFTVQNGVMWTPLQRWYWGQYLNTEVFPTRANDPHGHYRLLAKVDRRGQQHMAVDADVVPVRTLGRQLIPFALSAQARQAGAVELVVDTVRYPSQQMHQMLSEWIYGHQSPNDLIPAKRHEKASRRGATFSKHR